MTKLDEMWAALDAYQPQADAAGHGESWAAMCQLRTIDAAEAATNAAADAWFADAAYSTDAVFAAAYAANAADAADAATETWAQRAIGRISKVLKVAEPVALAEQPAAFKPQVKWTYTEMSNGCCGIRWVNAEGVQGVPTREDVETYMGYTSQPAQRKPLTDEQIEDLYFDKFSMGELKAFARAIEAAHNIKGNA